jgi:glucose/mannose-6-phosphate isomerase
MKAIIDSLPVQIRKALDLVHGLSIKKKKYSRVIVCGMGGSGISGAIARALYPEILIIPNNDYEIPHAIDRSTLGIMISYSGNTEETLACYSFISRKGADRVIISSNGRLLRKKAIAKIQVPAGLPPRGALGYLFTPLPVILNRCGLLPKNPERDLISLTRFLARERPALIRRARAIANKINTRLPIIYVNSSRFHPVAQRWQCQLNENAKIITHINMIPEMNHNEIVSLGLPGFLRSKSIVLQINDPHAHPRNKLRAKLLKAVVKKDMPATISIQPRGTSSLLQVFWSLWLGDYVSYYCAKLSGIDPMPVKRIERLKKLLARY